MTVFYSTEPDVMACLGRFLEASRGKPLVLVCNDMQEDEFWEYEDVTESYRHGKPMEGKETPDGRPDPSHDPNARHRP
mgnify:CR=1 FL=1